MKTVFITGINGLLGTNLCHLLLDEGYTVKGLIRDKLKYKGKTNDNLQLIEGELFDDLSEDLSGVDYVVHTAAITDQNLINYNEYKQINYQATLMLFHTAVKCNVKRFIYVSTANTLGQGSIEKPGSEEKVMSDIFKKSLYALSKKKAESKLLKQKKPIDVIVVNPTFMIGAFDSKPSSGKIILRSWHKRIVFYPPGGKNFVHVKDVALGILKSIENGKNGENYLLSNENLSFKEFFEKVNRLTHQKPLMIQIPKSVLITLGMLGEILRKLGVKTNLSLVNMKILSIKNYYTNQKSKRELGLTYRPITTAIDEAVQFFKKSKNYI